ncbi:L,D-transpeptidase family protein [Prosthecobacter sp. SYSU 5D2]|uniref:L,D-transpeptidase family protein n=1 Tax=Prosthecobacter sp. SYSU 5D2 TaxID=3134134 RepID=UPI0031FF1598
MKNTLWLLLLLGAGLALFSSQKESGSCSDCGPLPDISNLAALGPGSSTMKLPYPAPPAPEDWQKLTAEERLAHVKNRVQKPLATELEKKGLKLGAPAFLRIFKESDEMELWLQEGRQWKLFRTYPIAAMSGDLGPKMKEGDGQAPEGFYAVTKAGLNPKSTFHLSFNIGYPNDYDRHHGRTGSFIMVHGNEVSIGCFAMTDPVIEEIYLVVEAALNEGQAEVPVHSFPFRMTGERLTEAADHPAASFWKELLPVYLAFQPDKPLPQVYHRAGQYRLH